MASRAFQAPCRLLTRSAVAQPSRQAARLSPTSLSRNFQSSSIRRAEAAAQPVKKPVGAFRGGLFGFLIGSVGAGVAVYYYILEEYRISNQLLTEDIFALQAAVQRIEAYVRNVEDQIQKKN